MTKVEYPQKQTDMGGNFVGHLGYRSSDKTYILT